MNRMPNTDDEKMRLGAHIVSGAPRREPTVATTAANPCEKSTINSDFEYPC